MAEMKTLHTCGEYPSDWPEIADRVRAEAGHRCIRCKHPYKVGDHGNGGETPCSIQCTHTGPIYIWNFRGVEKNPFTDLVAGEAVREGYKVTALWRILTVHHFNGIKSDCEWFNLLSLCQRCHLIIQGRVNPDTPWFLEHSEWLKPYVAGFYARKYLGETLTREQVMERLDELLALERIA